VLFNVDEALYDVALDGSGLQPISLDGYCGAVSATADGRWAVCQDEGFGNLEVISLTANPPAVVHVATIDETRSTGSAVLSPDGHSLAAVSTYGGGCAIHVYNASASLDSFSLRAVLSLPQFLSPGSPALCTVSALSWSPDQTQLALVVDTTAQPKDNGVYVLPVAALLPSRNPAEALPISLVVPPARLTRLGPAPAFQPPAWSRVTGALAVTLGGNNIVRVNLSTHERTRLLTIPDTVDSWAVAWTSDSRQLVFSIEVIPCADCPSAPGPHFALYVYAPPV
jgi:hypothetical protein